MRALANELTTMRVRAGFTTRQVAARLGTSIATLNRTENAKRGATPVEVSAMLAVYGVIGAERKRLLEMAEGRAPAGWLATPTSRRIQALADFEDQAVSIVNFAPSYVPGLLQTRAYTREMMALGGITGEDLLMRVATRMDRQLVLTKLACPDYVAILDEAALRRPYGPPAVMAEQLRWLIERAKLPNVSIHVIPFRHGGYRNPGHFSKLEFAKAPPLIYVEHGGVSGFLDEPEDALLFRGLATTLAKVALGSAESVNFLARMAVDHERG